MKLVDLFCGSGGFSLGAHQAGFEVAAAFDNNRILTSSFRRNFPATKLCIRNVERLNGADVLNAAGGAVDGIFGGPPCQGFSDIGKRDKRDPRRRLLAHFFRVVAEVEPTFFVMENVRGLAYADARGVLDDALLLVRDKYSVFGPTILDAADFGAPTRRQRIFVVGIHKDRGEMFSESDLAAFRREPATVRAAIRDLSDATEVEEKDGFDVWSIRGSGRPSEYAKRLRASDRRFTGHRQTQHSGAVVRRFEKVEQGAVDLVGRHPRLSWNGQCPTLRAGTGSDKGSFQSVRPLHPDQPRVITVREGARLQGFPDRHLFHPTVWHSFRMIGNSVSPVISKSIFSAIGVKLAGSEAFAIAAE